jgi:argonaute-like protein implicated in RNA metabolism and viral defense
VFIVGSRNGDSIRDPDEKLSSITRGRTRYDAHILENGLPPPVNVSEAISDLPAINSGEGYELIEYDPKWIVSDYQRLMRDMISLNEFFTKRTEQG